MARAANPQAKKGKPMTRIPVFSAVAVLLMATHGQTQTKDDKAPPKKLPPQVVEELLNLTPEKFIERFDANKDGKLNKDEVPPFVAKGFEKFDLNSNGNLDRSEVAAMLPVLRKLMAAGPMMGKTVDEIVESLLKQMDTDKDGYLDRKELRAMAERMLAQKGPFGPKGPGGPDFDALDVNADGRLNRDELKGTPWAARFAEIDTDGNGYIDRREFESFLRREAARDKK
jgi:EF-hand domain pair/EF-hand domain/EF hand